MWRRGPSFLPGGATGLYRRRVAKPKKKGAKPKKTGRPSKMTPEVVATICETIKMGCTHQAAALRAGISEATLFNWLGRGKRSTHGCYKDFLEQVQRARADGEFQLAQLVRAGGPEGKGAQWMLDRRWRDTYGRRAAELARTEAEVRKLQAEADKAEAEAQLARDQSKLLGQGMTVDLTDDDDEDLTAGVTAADVAAASPTPLPGVGCQAQPEEQGLVHRRGKVRTG